MSYTFKAIKGFTDLFQPESSLFTYIEDTARTTFSLYNYEELRIPFLEQTGLFSRTIGLETDIVQKEMYTFLDRKGRSLSLRPEATAGILRAYIEHKKYTQSPIAKFLTIGPMFRYERPQKGRMRQFHQINCESLGIADSYIDAELIIMLMQFLMKLDITPISLELNSLGCKICRPIYTDVLQQWLKTFNPSELCDDCVRRRDINPLRVLDCKVLSCKEITKHAPHFLEYQCTSCLTQFSTVTMLLNLGNISYNVNHRLVRGLDYYMQTTFEVLSSAIGAQASIAGGGRYNGLVEYLGGPNIPGIGFACGMERLALLSTLKETRRSDFIAASLIDEGKIRVFSVTTQLHKAGFSGEMIFHSGSMKSIVRYANKEKVKYCLIVGSDELTREVVTIKDMDTGNQEYVSFDNVVHYFMRLLSKK